MKKIFLTLSLITIAFLTVNAQTTESVKQATWVIEQEADQPKVQTVKFYDDNLQLIYQETVNARLNISKKKVQKALNAILDSLISQQDFRQNKNVLAASFKLKH